MTDRKKVIVNINRQDYTVVSIESEEYIKEIARYVDENIKEILDKNSKLSNTMAGVLAAFNIADRYYKKSYELKDIKENVVKPLNELEETKKELEETKIKIEIIKEESEAKVKAIKEESETKIQSIIEENENEIKNLKEENEPYKEQLLKAKNEIEQLTKKNKQFENAIQIKEDELLSNQKIINDLQDKIFEHQMEIVQMKKQLEESLKLLDK
ncbi:cell division protein ZapA [Gottschalkia acidurici 9a]|uniref:Cell division protein ZapA n=1 Tax=Gottschalkia acidurici (strain ATCC 7906 / DSM 604 / BCRC 14475 / CIP 104303 / KCTC 5404 / NCIMB 10678 / 9a) TaxID=1128398 RepID=K0AZZ8_GOTA9|nr:cell division protein ZapA [Gottschalkia acidurici]AFS77931.1 cell division protein ZapA [Gottschalkia acidurici 9a]